MCGDGAETPGGSGLWLGAEPVGELWAFTWPSSHLPFSDRCELFPDSMALLKAHFQYKATEESKSPGADFGPKCNVTLERNRQNRQAFLFFFFKQIYLDIIFIAYSSLI